MRRACAAASQRCCLSRLSAHAARAGVLVHIDKSSQRMSVVGRRAARLSCGASRPGAAASARRPGASVRNGWRAAGSRRATTARRCRIRSSSTRATRSTAPTTSRASAAPASHGCVRLHPANAATLFTLVRRFGMGNTAIVITGGTSLPSRQDAARKRRHVTPRTVGYPRHTDMLALRIPGRTPCASSSLLFSAAHSCQCSIFPMLSRRRPAGKNAWTRRMPV